MNKKEYNFQKLTPINDADLSIYDDALNFVFANNDIRNVAISGGYSAGKSSVIESYKKHHNNIKFLHISLAHFKSIMGEEEPKTETKESVLEGKILNQLIHQIDPNKLPQTNFKIKHKVNSKKITRTVILEMLFFIMVLHITLFESWCTFVSVISTIWIKNMLSLTTYSEARLISGIICTIILGIAITKITRIQKNRNMLRKINLQGNEIEIFQETTDSYFDKYLNEVLYVFENVDADVIVFEDMDRYNINQIFERLHEINILVNIERKTPLRFFYLLRDDIFVSKDRTKFFDYIIPIVPVIDSSNSYDKFIEHFKKGGIFNLFDESFLQGLSLYVDDMRILKNIYNEFVIYNNRISTTEQDHNKLLALITYKNLFPKDFSDLQLNKGFVYTLFSKKGEFVHNEIVRIDEKIDDINEKIQAANNESLRSDAELDSIYNPKIQEISRYYSRSEELKRLQSELSERKEAVKNRANGNIQNFNEKIFDLQKKQQILKNKKLYEIISRENIDDIFRVTYTNEIGQKYDFNDIKSSEYFDLIKYLIRNRFIDETYADYMTYFYENSLSRIDKVFLRSVTDKKAKEYTYQLKKPQMIIDRLRNEDFDQEEVLNFNLLDYLLNASVHNEKLNRFIEQLKQTKNLKFISEFFDEGKQQGQFVTCLNKQWNQFFYIMRTESSFSEIQKKHYAINTLYYSSDDSIESMNQDGCLTYYISHDSNFLNIEHPNISKLIHGFKLIGVSFLSISYSISNKELFSFVYKHCLYQLSFENLKLMLEVFYSIAESKDVKHKNYTLVMTNREEPLAEYINENIDDYIGIILEHCENSITDDEDKVLFILNNDEITMEHKTDYIKELQTSIVCIDNVNEKNLWRTVFEQNLAVYSEDNILQYFYNNENKIDKTLIDFINEQEEPLDFSAINSTFGEDAPSKLFNAVIVCNDLNDDRYSCFIKTLRRYYAHFSIEGISDSKVKILIDLKTIKMNSESLTFMREQYPDYVPYYIEKNIDEYVCDVITEEMFDLNEALSVLELDIDDTYKIKLLEFTDSPISSFNAVYSQTLKEYILKNNLEPNDIPKLLLTYPKESAILKPIVLELAINYRDTIFDAEYPLSIELYEELLEADHLSKDDKVEFSILILPKFNEQECKNYFNKLGLTNYIKLFSRGRPKFEVNETNERILKIFEQKKWITSFDYTKDDTNYYRAYRKKIH